MQCSNEEHLPICTICKFSHLLQEIQLFLWIMFCRMFQHFTKFIYHKNQELSPFLTDAIVVFNFVHSAYTAPFYTKRSFEQN